MSLFLNEKMDGEEGSGSFDTSDMDDFLKESMSELGMDDEEDDEEEDYEFDLDSIDLEESAEALSDEEIGQINSVIAEAPIVTTRKVIVKTKAQKTASLTQKASMTLAKKNKDPMYTAYEKARKAETALRKKIEKKYGSAAKGVIRDYQNKKK
jgi:uncharacterized membrane protein